MNVVSDLIDIVGAEHVLVDPDVLSGYVTDWTGRFRGQAACVVRPASHGQVVAVVELCRSRRTALVPQGGNTSLVAGATPSGDAVVISTRRLNHVEPIDHAAGQITVGAGVTLGALQQSLRDSDLEFGIDLAARDSATIGGMVATNAGGTRAVSYTHLTLPTKRIV